MPGNPAAVIIDFNGNDNEKQQLAEKLNLPVIVFVENNHIPKLRFFYPEREMPLCLHGILAAGYYLMQASNQLTCTVSVQNRTLQLFKQDNIVQVAVSASAKEIEPPTFDNSLIQQMLNLKNQDDIDLYLPQTIKSVGSPKLLIPLISPTILHSLKPNFDLIKRWSIENQVNGLYVYAKQDNHFIARGFNPKGGHNEDAATGVAAAALALAFERSITVYQGRVLHKVCKLEVVYHNPQHILVGGLIFHKSGCFS